MKRLTRPLVIAMLGGLTILLLVKLGDIDISLATLRQIDPLYLSLAIVIHYSGFVMRGWRWQKLLHGLGYRLNYGYLTALLMSGWFVSALVPARLGDVGRVYLLRRDHQVPLAQGFASIATERALDIVAILGLAALTATWALAGRTPAWVWQTLAGGVLVGGLGLVALVAMPRLEGWLVNLLPWAIYRKVMSFGFELVGSIRQVAQKPRLLTLLLAQSLYIWLCDVCLMVFIFYSLDLFLPISIPAFTSMAVDLAAAVPIIPGAVGQVEATAVGVMSLFALSTQQSSLIILINRFISFWTFIIVSGAVTYLFGFSQALDTKQLAPAQSQMPVNNA